MFGKIEHVPVLVNEVLELLKPCLSAGTVIDATAGGGGHLSALARELLKLVPASECHGRLVGIDVDAEAIGIAESQLGEFGCKVVRETAGERFPDSSSGWPMILLMKENYVNMGKVAERLGINQVSGVLMDLGLSSYQLQARRGFSFEQDGPLDMRFDQKGSRLTARELLRRATEKEIETWLRVYGDEPRAKKVSRQIFALRKKIETTGELTAIVARVVPKKQLRKTLARVFQALRIVVNDELANLRQGLKEAIRILTPNGRLLVICYQSGEDRCFKEVVRENKDQLCLLTRKPIRPGGEEIQTNPRARSARLRAARKISQGSGERR